VSCFAGICSTWRENHCGTISVVCIVLSCAVLLMDGVLMLMRQNTDEEEDDDDVEVRSELTQLTDKLRETEMTSNNLMSQLQTTDAAVEDDSKRVCKRI